MQGEAPLAVRQAREALAALDDSNVRARSLAGIGLGLASLSQGAASEAAEAFRNVATINRATNYALFNMLATVGEACAHRLVGDLDRARATYEQAMVWSRDHAHPSLLAGSLDTGLADLLREGNQLDDALDRAMAGLRLSAALGALPAERWIEWHVCDLLILARIKQARSDLDGALAVVQEAQNKLAGFGAGSFTALLAAFEAQVHVARGDLAAAVQWLRSAGAHGAPPKFGLTPQVFVCTHEHLEIAPIQVLLAQGRAASDPEPVRRALVLLDQQRDKAARAGLTWLHCKALALQALAYELLGETALALGALDPALALAQPAGYIRLFVDEGPPMAGLLRRLPPHTTAPDHVEAVLAAWPAHAVATPGRHAGQTAAPSLMEPLTGRERDVLRLLAAGRSNPEMARMLYVEVNTVKTHLKRLYGKLGVHGRVQAAQRARDLGLL
jgi:LuxR family maltose regulon positive regulatory protein